MVFAFTMEIGVIYLWLFVCLFVFRVFGYYWGVQFAWLIIELDFSDAVPNQCSQPDDYFTWIPSDGVSHTLCMYTIVSCTSLTTT